MMEVEAAYLGGARRRTTADGGPGSGKRGGDRLEQVPVISDLKGGVLVPTVSPCPQRTWVDVLTLSTWNVTLCGAGVVADVTGPVSPRDWRP